MPTTEVTETAAPSPAFLDRGRVGVLIRAHDWGSVPIGHPAEWPQPLKTLMGLMLASIQPMFVAWGPERTLLYNDAYAPLLAGRHPEALGRPFFDVWREIRDDHTPLFESVFAGNPVHMDDITLQLNRRGVLEETHFAFSYTPIRDENGAVAGLFCACSETTRQVLAERERTKSTERLREMFEQAPGFIAMLRGPEHVFELTNAAYSQLIGGRDVVGMPIRDALPEVEGQGFFELLDGVLASGETFVGKAMPVDLKVAPEAPIERRFLDFVYQAIRGADGAPTGIFVEGADVTERVLAEAELRESEERGRRIIEGVKGYAIFTTDLAGLVDDWTPGAEAIFGWSAEDIRGRSAELLFTPEDRDAGVPARELATARAKGCANDERWHIRRDGTRLFANGSVRLLHGSDGEVVGFIKIARDETEERAVQARLRASEEFNRRVLASSADCIKVLDLNARLEFMSEGGMCVMEVDDFGAVEGQCWPDFWPEAKQPEVLSAIDAAKAGAAARFQGYAPTMKGAPRWWDVIVTPITDADGRPERLLSISRDVTATKQAEEALRELNETLERQVAERTDELRRFRDIIEATTSPICAFDIHHRLIAFNKAHNDEFRRVNGFDTKLGDVFPDLFVPEQRTVMRALMDRALTGERFTVTEEFGRPELDVPLWEISYTPLLGANGEIVGAFHLATDISDRLRAQAELATAQEALRQSQKLEAMGQLTGGVSHDFNNLLTPIIGSLDLLQRKGLGGEREQRLINGALQSAERAKTLVQRLLAFARRQPLQAEAVDVAELIEGMRDLVVSTTGPQVRVVVQVAPHLPAAKADANQLEMALLNLAVNARDAMPGGGVLTISAEFGAVEANNRLTLRAGRYVRLAVADNGAGMDEATLARAIEPFFSTKGVGRGTGLGLSMVHGLAAQLGGALDITTKLGTGTKVELWLPATEDAVARSRQADPVEEFAVAGAVLLVDDEELARMSTADMLGELGYAVVEAGSAEEALRLVEGGTPFDILITDHLMPGMSGTELAQVVRLRRPGTPVLVVSGYAEVEGIPADLPRLTKPFRQLDLGASLAALEADR